MGTFHTRTVRFLATRNPQTLAELCIIPTTAGEWGHWLTWLVIAILE